MKISVVTRKPFSARRLGDAARQALADATVATGFAVKARAVPRIPVDTGFAKNTVYVKTPEGSEYDEATSNALAALATAGKAADSRAVLPETSEPAIATADSYSVVVAGGAEYLFWLHEGARGRAGIPFFSEAAEAERGDYEKRVARALDGGFSNV